MIPFDAETAALIAVFGAMFFTKIEASALAIAPLTSSNGPITAPAVAASWARGP